MHLLVCLSFVVGANGVGADDAKVLSVGEPSAIKYKLVHKAHTVNATAKKNIEGKVKLAGGQAQIMVRVPVASFDSENSNRDSHMRESVEESKYPHVELKALADGVKPGETKSAVAKGKLTFHGVTNTVEVPLGITWSGPTAAHVTGKFSISLEGYKVERPSLLFVKVEDKLDLEVDLTVKE